MNKYGFGDKSILYQRKTDHETLVNHHGMPELDHGTIQDQSVLYQSGTKQYGSHHKENMSVDCRLV